MKWIFWLVEAGASFVECICCYYFLSCIEGKDKIERIKTEIILSIILSIFILGLNNFKLSSFFTILFAVCFVSISLKISCLIPMQRTFPLVGFYYSYMNAIDFLCATALGSILGDRRFMNKVIVNFSGERSFFIIVSKALLILCTLVLRKVLEQFYYVSKYFFIITFLSGIGCIYLIKLTFASVTFGTALNWGFFLILMMLVIFTLGMYGRYREEREKRQMVQLSNKMIQEQYADLMESNEKVRKLQHDFKNHMYVLLELLQNDKFEEAKEYLTNIGIPVYENRNTMWTGNIIVDFILNYKRDESYRKGIDFNINADIVLIKKLHNEDICVILSNLLDNAIEAAQKSKEGERWIQVTIRKVEGLLIIRIQNSIGIYPVLNGNSLQTLKVDGDLHGIGLESIRMAVGKYHGEFHYIYDENSFQANVTFFDN